MNWILIAITLNCGGGYIISHEPVAIYQDRNECENSREQLTNSTTRYICYSEKIQ
jgi:hypothetical protein